MDRVDNVCPGDCTKCQLLREGKVEMTSCVLDQVFQRVQDTQEMLAKVLTNLEENKFPRTLASHKLNSED